jgi:D-lyxose ketol-isomerase
MIKRSEVRAFQAEAKGLLRRANVLLTPTEQDQIEVAECGLGRVRVEGLGIFVYVNTDRYCAKELIMIPRQTCPQHRHPPVGTDPGKMETFRCRWGKVWLYLDGPPTGSIRARVPLGKEAYYTARHEIELNPGDQYTIPPDRWHWFQSGDEGAVVSEFSSTSRDEFDVFTDPGVKRITEIVED